MAMDLDKFRRLLALDGNDPLSRFALGKKLLEVAPADDSARAMLEEAAGHLRFANDRAPQHLATYHVLAQVLIRIGQLHEARDVLTRGIDRVAGVGEGMGRDLGPAMEELLVDVDRRGTVNKH